MNDEADIALVDAHPERNRGDHHIHCVASKRVLVLRFKYQADLLGGIVMLTHTGAAYRKPLESEPLYEPVGLSGGHTTKPVELRFIPYYAWSNREPGAMAVWVPAPL